MYDDFTQSDNEEFLSNPLNPRKFGVSADTAMGALSIGAIWPQAVGAMHFVRQCCNK